LAGQPSQRSGVILSSRCDGEAGQPSLAIEIGDGLSELVAESGEDNPASFAVARRTSGS
jgi:hypothetical protein